VTISFHLTTFESPGNSKQARSVTVYEARIAWSLGTEKGMWKPDILGCASILMLQIPNKMRRARVRLKQPGKGHVVAPKPISFGVGR